MLGSRNAFRYRLPVRTEVQDFLRRLQSYMRAELANRDDVIRTVSDTARKTKGKDYEASMVDEFVLPGLNRFLAACETQNLNGKKPEAVTLAESSSSRPKYAVGSPVPDSRPPPSKGYCGQTEGDLRAIERGKTGQGSIWFRSGLPRFGLDVSL